MEPMSEEEKNLLKDKTKEYVQHNARTLERLGLKMKMNVRFPGGKTPLLGRIGIWLVNLAGGMMDMEFRPRDTA